MVARGRYFAGAAAQPPKEAGAAPLIHHCDRSRESVRVGRLGSVSLLRESGEQLPGFRVRWRKLRALEVLSLENFVAGILSQGLLAAAG